MINCNWRYGYLSRNAALRQCNYRDFRGGALTAVGSGSLPGFRPHRQADVEGPAAGCTPALAVLKNWNLIPAFSLVFPSAFIAKVAKMGAHRELDRACFLPARFKDHAPPSALPAGPIGPRSPKPVFLPIVASCWAMPTGAISDMMDRNMR